MNETQSRSGWLDYIKHEEGRRSIPQEELDKHAGLHVAYSLDGTRILASGATWDELFDNMDAAGIDPSQVVGSYIPLPGVSLI